MFRILTAVTVLLARHESRVTLVQQQACTQTSDWVRCNCGNSLTGPTALGIRLRGILIQSKEEVGTTACLIKAFSASTDRPTRL